jgi:predicted enzyme related to lactoylglutathione lyase
MPQSRPPGVGAITWTDLTVREAERLRDFYSKVVGWTPEPLEMGGYADYVMKSPTDGASVAGVCHARGDNKDLPPQWLVYITVESLDASIKQCKTLGGRVLAGPRSYGDQGRYAVIEDPAGAVCALYETTLWSDTR